VNYYSNITPQKADLNQGPWMRLESKVRDLVDKYNHVWVMTGPLYEREMPQLPKSDEPHKVPSGYWKIIVVKDAGNILVAAFIMDQETARSSEVINHLVTIDEVEIRSKLDFLWLLPDTEENSLESTKFQAWVQEWAE
jgi:endonuclease G